MKCTPSKVPTWVWCQQSVFGQIYHCGCTKPPINLQFCDFY